MNHAQTVDHEKEMMNQFRREGRKLIHLCPDWDFMAIHADTDEILACSCDFYLESDQILRDEICEKRNAQAMAVFNSTSQDFSTLGAPAHSGTDLGNRVAVACMLVSNPTFRKEGWQKQVNDLLREMRNRIEGSK